jgi:hypothetical protein
VFGDRRHRQSHAHAVVPRRGPAGTTVMIVACEVSVIGAAL